MYPTCRYHKDGSCRVIHSPTEEERGWLPNPGMHLDPSDSRYVAPPAFVVYSETGEAEPSMPITEGVSMSLKPRVCRLCGEPGHDRRSCPTRR